MRTPQPGSNIQEHRIEDEDGSVVSEEICQSIGSSSSFSVQECINKFRSEKMHNSSQSNQNTDEDLIFQNNSNKKNERISKPCKDGFCYCFTSDSDDVRAHREKRKGRKSDSAGQQNSDMSNSSSNVTRRESFSLHSTRRRDAHHKTRLTRKVTAVSKLEDTSQSPKAPLIHIIQEIRNNCVVSEVRVNQQKIRQHRSPTKARIPSEKKIINSVSDLPKYSGGVSEVESLAEKFQNSSLNTSARSSDRNGGRLLQKRLSGTSAEFRPRNLSTPPRKPPRNVVPMDVTTNNDQTSVGTTPSIREAEKILDDFLLRKGIPIPQKRGESKEKRHRKSYPMDEGMTGRRPSKFHYEKPLPSCPSLSDIERLGSEKYAESAGFVQEQPIDWSQQKIREMLNVDAKSKNFDSTNAKCGPQVGWSVPPKLDIDTVDGVDHNLVANITSKCTPVKNEMFNNKTESQKFILAEQLKNIVSNSPWTSKKAKDKQNLKKSNSFLSASKTKILRFVTKKSPPKNKSIGVQTREDDGNRSTSNLQSPPGSYFSNTVSNTPAKSSKGSQTEFDFSRTIQSPKREKVPQRKLLFPARNVKETRLNSKQNQTYHSYNSDLDKDFTLSKMCQVLSNIKCRLEASDEHAVGTFRDIQRKEAAAAAALSYDCVDGYDYSPAHHTSAQADIHNEAEPSYSEIEEDSLHVAGSPVMENTNAIEHFFVGSDPTAIYAKINKTPKKSKPHTSSFNNVMEQNSPPKLRHVSKTDLSVQSEIFLENLTSETNTYAHRLQDGREREKVQNVSQEERTFEGTNLDDSYVTVDSFRDTMDKDSDAVSYEYPDESINPINEEQCAGNQSTPKKTMHLTKFGAELASNDDLRHTESCPTTPGWLSHHVQDFNPREESLSLQEEIVEKPGISNLWKYRTIKSKLSQSIRKSRHFLKNERKRITGSLNLSKPIANANLTGEQWDASSLCLANLFAMDESAPLKDQLTQAVGICRQYPELETSPEMVEAERLLLFSTLKREIKNPNTSLASQDDRPKGCMDIKTLRLPIKENTNQEIFFNFYYIGVFSCGRLIKSTQSADCMKGEAIFRDCNIQFDNIEPESEVRCDIFMLRLRKVSTTRKPLSKAKKLSSASTSSEEILSRFRPHASFVLKPRDFVPYTLMESCDSTNGEYLRLHATGACKLSVRHQARSTNLLNEVYVCAEVEQLFKTVSRKGFLNVQDVNKMHSWNLRWCELDSLILRIWNSPSDVLINEPVHIVDLRKCISNPVAPVSREVCARSRSFCLEFEANEPHSGFFFSADNQVDLNHWMSALNEALEFIATWMR